MFEELLTEQAKSFMVEEIAKDIVLLLMEEKGMTMREALHVLYTSDTYARLTDTKNQLYTQSTFYVYEYLENELAKGKIA